MRQIEQKVIQKLKEHQGLQKMLGIEDDIEKMNSDTGTKKKRGRKPSAKESDEYDDEDFYAEYGDDEDFDDLDVNFTPEDDDDE
ncbi:hypothetical protein IJU97_01180 [bacterium]|nr:hypothetical protein [bacterium]